MKKLLAIVVFILTLVGCANQTLEEDKEIETPKVEEKDQDLDEEEKIAETPQFDEVSFDMLIPDGSTAMALTHFKSTMPNLGDHVKYTISSYTEGSDALADAFTSETSQVIVAPTNLGATLYQQGVPYQLVASLVWGDLYLISQESLNFDDLAGKKITTFGEGSTPDIVLQCILKEKGLLDSVEIEYLPSVADVQARFASGETEIALFAEPSLSVLKTTMDHVNVVMDFQEQWRELYGGNSYPQVSLFVHKDLIENHQEVIEPLLAQIDAGISFANESTEEMANEAIQIGFEMPENSIIESIPQSNLMFKTAENACVEVDSYLKKLYEFNPETVGGSLPNEDFYYFVN